MYDRRRFSLRASVLLLPHQAASKQRRLLFRRLLAHVFALRLQQFTQQGLVLVMFGERAIHDQFDHDLLQRLLSCGNAHAAPAERSHRKSGKDALAAGLKFREFVLVLAVVKAIWLTNSCQNRSESQCRRY